VAGNGEEMTTRKLPLKIGSRITYGGKRMTIGAVMSLQGERFYFLTSETLPVVVCRVDASEIEHGN